MLSHSQCSEVSALVVNNVCTPCSTDYNYYSYKNMSSSSPVPYYLTATISTAGVIGGLYYGYKHYQDHKNKLPDQWTRIGHLKRLYIYPIKSCAPILLNQGECTDLGMRDGWLRDRVLMVVEAESNDFITARAFPELLKVQPSIKNALITLNYPDSEPIEVNLAEIMVTQQPKKATVWDATVPVYDCGEEASKWFTKILNKPDISFRLVYYASRQSRPLLYSAVPKVFKKMRKSDTGIFPDETAFNLINEASVDDLNKRLVDHKVDETNFRPNFFVSGSQAFDEDNWQFIKIGQNIFEVIKPCSRCVMTTIDKETGMSHKNKEPLETLKSYRLNKDPKLREVMQCPRMGIQMALRSGPGGAVSLHDDVYVAY